MQKLKDNKSFCLLFFLALFGFSIGLFDNYRELWMSTNGLSTTTISHVISISYIVTVFVLFYFTVRVSTNKLKWGICITLALNMITGATLICLNGTENAFLIKFLMFFNIAFSQLILASVYPLMMNISKDDVLYTKKSFVESLFSKLGFLLVAILLGKTIFHTLVDYNICLLLSVIFNFLAFLVLMAVPLENKMEERFNIKNTISYFNHNKVLYQFLFVNFLGDMIWGAILGMPMLLLTTNMNFSSNFASYFILGLGICSSFLSMIVVKHLRLKNDHGNFFIKYGVRFFFYFLIFITNSKWVFLITLVYLFLTDCLYGFIFSSYFIHNIEEKYSLFLTTLRYCSSLLGKAIGTFFCGLVFHLDLRYFVIPALLISVIHYVFATILIEKRELIVKKS